jgi:hypothetical protein
VGLAARADVKKMGVALGSGWGDGVWGGAGVPTGDNYHAAKSPGLWCSWCAIAAAALVLCTGPGHEKVAKIIYKLGVVGFIGSDELFILNYSKKKPAVVVSLKSRFFCLF